MSITNHGLNTIETYDQHQIMSAGETQHAILQ